MSRRRRRTGADDVHDGNDEEEEGEEQERRERRAEGDEDRAAERFEKVSPARWLKGLESLRRNAHEARREEHVARL